ncbi:MAG: Secreted enzyme, contains two amidohydrolase related domains [uncultured Chthoniobacterales bacterium]|uniref:Secreted enzyme, contains two amidohydrolase related domains n=1 Tax=uncultured Chthoniobacterales bacterium TaxID=1836801 RepID=A0A6J4I9N1_9BACT|nr:MAG: Secreted enzyme, contains two amidohydrolase related domains [uncultured Chthoniobacterales bacterium]
MRFPSPSVARRTFVALLAGCALSASAQITTAPKHGIRENDPRLHALTNARVVTAPGKVIEKGAVVIRDGVIVDVGPSVKIPPDARVWDLTGKTIYAGFIDSYSRIGLPDTLKPEPLRSDVDQDNPEAKPKDVPREAVKGMHAWNPRVTPERNAADYLKVDKKAAGKLRDLGFTSALVVPGRGIFRGSSALINLQDADINRMVVSPSVAQHIALDFDRSDDGGYPNSLMGAIALVRQNFLDAGWYQAAQDAYAKKPATTERPEANASLAALAEHARRKQPAVFEAEDELDLLRVLKIADEFKLRPLLLGNGYEYRVRKALAEKKAPVILPLEFPKVPEIERPEQAVEYQLDELQHWDRAPSNPARLAEAGIPIAFTTEKLEKADKEFWSRIRLVVRRGLNKDAALAALTTTPAEMFGAADRMGTVAPGRVANLVIASGDLFSEEAKVLTTWVDGFYYDSDLADDHDLRGTWEVTVDGKTLPLIAEGEPDKLDAKLGGEKVGFSATADAVLLVAPARLLGGGEGGVRLSGRLAGDTVSGTGDAPAGATVRWSARRTAPHVAKKPDDKPTPGDRPLDFPETYPAGAFGRVAPPELPRAVLVQGATVWTSAAQGTLQNADVLVTDGKISAVGPGLKAPAGASVIDAKGAHVTPGIIDCHSHTAISKGVNESSHAVTCEVRIADVIDATDIDLYRQLGGGVTAANILHGSANPIGGQNQVIKFRWGGLPEELKLTEAAPGVKFALGENVKQSNRGHRSTRYPQTRMGVEQLIRDRFRAAQEYDAAMKKKDGLPPRRDLQLEALSEMLGNKRLIHCHSYRLDEIHSFLKVTGEFGVKPATLQHILEGYKVADEIAKAGVGASSFADWWAYKWEAFDAIPDNATIMHEQRVLTSINSDSADLARRLNTEAAKMTKYGGMSPDEALKLVTLYPAQQLRVDAKVGSLEPGKDADFVIWNGHPLSNYTRVNQTWIDGRKYFDRADDMEARKSFAAQREALVQKALAERVKELGKPKDDDSKKDTQGDKDAAPKPPGSVYDSGGDRDTCSEHEHAE